MRKKHRDLSTPSRYERLSRPELIDLLEATMMRSSELFRGLNHSELDQAWVLSRLETHAEQALGAIRALQRKMVDLQTF